MSSLFAKLHNSDSLLHTNDLLSQLENVQKLMILYICGAIESFISASMLTA